MSKDVTTLVPYFGSNRTNASRPGALLKGCSWVGIPFAGGMCEVPHFDARTVVVNDKHDFVINLANVLTDPVTGPKLYRKLKREIFHPGSLDWAQDQCSQWMDGPWDIDDEELAAYYFVCAWMGRSGLAGTDGEFNSSLALRWTATGGDSARRYQSAVKALNSLRRTLRRCTFSCLDCFDFLDNVNDEEGHGLYCDPPWPKDGDSYRHKFTLHDQRELARVLMAFRHCKVVVRYGDHPLIRELYPPPHWRWHLLDGRTQANKVKQEVLLTNFTEES